jgi:DNA-binding transcriptional MocR family regulator
VQTKQSADLHSNSFGQHLLELFVSEGHFTNHVEVLKGAYSRRRDAMAAALRQRDSLSLRFNLPDGGFYIWCGIPEGIEQSALMAHAAARGVSFLPGRACFAAEPPENAIRLNFTHCPEDGIDEGIQRLRDAICETVRIQSPSTEGVATSPVV